jgi:hypothetical protein
MAPKRMSTRIMIRIVESVMGKPHNMAVNAHQQCLTAA